MRDTTRRRKRGVIAGVVIACAAIALGTVGCETSPLGLGAACGLDVFGSNVSVDCEEDLICARIEGTFLCTGTNGGVGSPCRNNNSCSTGLECKTNTTDSDVCTAP